MFVALTSIVHSFIEEEPAKESEIVINTDHLVLININTKQIILAKGGVYEITDKSLEELLNYVQEIKVSNITIPLQLDNKDLK